MFGRTRLVKSLRDKQYYALNMMKKSRIVRLQQLQHVQNEVTILSRLRCVFAVEMKALFQDENSVYLLSEFVPGGELYSHLRRVRAFDLELYKFYTVEAACAMQHLHELNIVYRCVLFLLALCNICMGSISSIGVCYSCLRYASSA